MIESVQECFNRLIIGSKLGDSILFEMIKVEDLCLGTNFDIKICGGNKPDECPVQRGSCDADGFRPIYWQHLANEGFSAEFKEECYNDHSKCQFGHNPPLKVSHIYGS